MKRQNFEHSMETLQDNMAEMVEKTIEALQNAFKALEAQDANLALTVIENDASIDNLEDELNQMAVWFITKQQPVAHDLRKIIAILKMSTDIERIADFAVNTAKAVIRIDQQESLLHRTSLLSMKNQTIEMLKEVLKAFKTADFSLAEKMGDLDDYIDDQNKVNYQILMSMLKQNPEQTEQIVELLFINRFVERAADHITNMAESTAYFIKGQLYDIN